MRFQTGNLPNGVVISADGRRAYCNNEANVSVTAINLQNNTVIVQGRAGVLLIDPGYRATKWPPLRTTFANWASPF